jgi:sortase A
LPAADLPMRGDRAAWLLVVLWAEALLVLAVAFVWARHRWGRWQAWVVGVPMLAFVGLSLALEVTRLLPNLT